MIWSYFSCAGTGKLNFIEGEMNDVMQQGILDDNLLLSAKYLKLPRGGMFQQKNDPKHTSKDTVSWLQRNKIKAMEWPSP